MDVPRGTTVGIQGLDGLGHLSIQYAKRWDTAVALSRDSQKEKHVRELSAKSAPMLAILMQEMH